MKLLFPRRPGALLAIAALGLSLGACETDLDPNDSYRETTFIYAVLDPALRDAAGQPVQRISINKAFLNTGTNALTIAAKYLSSTSSVIVRWSTGEKPSLLPWRLTAHKPVLEEQAA